MFFINGELGFLVDLVVFFRACFIDSICITGSCTNSSCISDIRSIRSWCFLELLSGYYFHWAAANSFAWDGCPSSFSLAEAAALVIGEVSLVCSSSSLSDYLFSESSDPS